MRFLRKAPVAPARLGILSAAFHPPTRAHLAIAQTALDLFETDEVLFVLPESFPHKHYGEIGLEARIEMLLKATQHEPRYSVGVTEGGLFLEIARECRSAYQAGVRLRFLCGRDAASRIVEWDYGTHPPIEEQLREYELLVAPRKGDYRPPAGLPDAVSSLPMSLEFDDVSSTEVRSAIASGRTWEHLVPDAITELVQRLYR